MKHFITQRLAGLMLALLGMAMTASADTSKVIKVNIPFEFIFGGRTLPAGEYSVTQPIQNVISLRNERGQTVGSVLTDPVDSATAAAVSKLRFTSVGGQHILSEVWQDEETRGQQLVGAKERTQSAAREPSESRSTDNGGQQ